MSETSKQEKARQEAVDSKRKAVVYTIIGVICAIAAAALLIWNSGFFQSRAVAMTVGDVEYTVPQVDYFYMELYNQYAYYGMLDGSIPADEQVYDEETGETWHDFFLSYAEESLSTLTALYQAAVADGRSLTEEELQSVEDQIEQYRVSAISAGYGSLESYLRMYYGQYMTTDIYRNMLQMQILGTNYYNDYQEGLTYSEDELDAYYDENSGTLDTYVHSSCFIPADAAEDATEEEEEAALAAARETADAMAAELEAGGDFAQLAEEYTAGQEDAVVSVDLTVPGNQLSSLYGDWLRDDARESGDVTVAESSTGNGCFVVQFTDRYLLTSDTVDLRRILIEAETDEGADAPTQAQMDAALEEAEALLDEWKAGDATEESFAELAAEHSDDTSASSTGGLYNIYKGQMIPGFDEWAFDSARQAGDTGIVEDTTEGHQGYHIIYYIGTDEPYWMQQADSSLRTQDTADWLEEITAGYPVTQGSGVKYVG